MLKALYIFVAAVAVCNAAIIQNVQRAGNVNRYFVYTRQNFYDPKEIIPNDPDTITQSDVLFLRDTVVIVHGHEGSAFNSLNPAMKNAFLQNLDVNVIVVDWSTFARMNYPIAVSAVPSVGVHLADLLTALVNANRVDLRRLHLVGFNLGAHVVGFAGRRLRGQVARITGLDPSGKQWESNSGRLTSSDALYVEVIHTDTQGSSANGLEDAIGNVDFYPNGGRNQPGCGASRICSHNRAWELFVATLNKETELKGYNCVSFSQLQKDRCNGDPLIMGRNDYTKLGSGIYRVNTKSAAPF